METKVLKPTDENIDLACKLIKNGKVVAVPTETVYGLAGNAFDKDAIKQIFIAKGRPADNPLIVHISDMEMLKRVARTIPKDAEILAKNFWPGPLTIIMPKADAIPLEVTAGLDSVGIRMPSNKIAREIISRSKTPFAAPSANLSGKPSPTTADDVFDDMNGRIPLIIDGGECDAGVESTVVSVLDDTPVILRPGIITKEQLEFALNKPVLISKGVVQALEKNEKVLSPGMKYKHYAPKAKVILIKSTLEKFKEFVNNNFDNDTFAMVFDGEEDGIKAKTITYGKIDDPKTQAHQLFIVLRKLDKLGAKLVYARTPDTDGVSLAVYNRLTRAAGFDIIEL